MRLMIRLVGFAGLFGARVVAVIHELTVVSLTSVRAARRARAGRTWNARALAGAVSVLVVAVALGVSLNAWRVKQSEAGSPIASPAAPSRCALPSSLELVRTPLDTSLVAAISNVQTTDRKTNQLLWTVRFLSAQGAVAPTTINARVEIMAGGNLKAGGTLLHVLGYDLIEPEQRTLVEGEPLTISRCEAGTVVVRTAGPLLEGTWPYRVTIGRIALPDGRAVAATLDLVLTCSNASFTCAPAGQATVPTATPNAALFRHNFAVIYRGTRTGWDPGSAPQIRREGDPSSVAELAGSFFNEFRGAVAPSGNRAAYFAQPRDGPWGLYLLEGAKPNDQRLLVSLPNETPGEVTWSSDESALAFTTQDAAAVQGVAPRYSALRTLDLATGNVAELARVTAGNYYHVVAWNRTANTLVATTGPSVADARSYVVIGASGMKTTSLDGAWRMAASPDAKTVAGVRCDAAPNFCSLWIWPLAEFGDRVDQHVAAGLSIGIFGWRPGSEDVGLIVGDGPKGEAELDVWSPSSGRRPLYRFSDGNTPPSSPFFRADGSAVFVPGYGEALVVDIATGSFTSLPFPAPTAPYDRPLPAASIRLEATR